MNDDVSVLVVFSLAIVATLVIPWAVQKVVVWYRLRQFLKTVLAQFGDDFKGAQVVIQDALFSNLAEVLTTDEMVEVVNDVRQRMGAIHSDPVVENNKKET